MTVEDLAAGRDVALEDVRRNTAFLQQAIENVARAGGGSVTVPPGDFVILTIELRSNVTLDLGPSSTIVAWPGIEDYPGQVEDATTKGPGRTSLIVATDCDRVSITGVGTIDGNGFAFWDEPFRTLAARGHTRESLGLPAYGEDDGPFWRPARPRVSPLVEIKNCTNVRVTDVHITNSPGWTLHLSSCDRVWIERIVIRNHLYGPNTDGVDINGCRDVVVHGCDISCGDDAIIVKAFEDAGSSEHITVTQCTLRTHCAALGIGAEVERPIRNVVFADCVVPKALRILQIELWTAGLVENVVVSNIAGDTMTDIPLERPVYIDVQHHKRADGRLGHVRNVTVTNLVAQTRGRMLLTAADGATIENVTLRDISLRLPEIEDPAVTVPSAKSSQMSNDNPETRSRRALLIADNVRKLEVVGLSVRWPGDDAGWSAAEAQHGSDFSAANGLNQDKRKIASISSDLPMHVAWLRRCEGVRLHAPFAEPHAGADRIVQIECSDVVVDE
jgi:polygalacturonase